jgi:outer membrane protein TolC
MGAVAPMAGCRRGPYLDPARSVPPGAAGASEVRLAEEDREVQQAQMLEARPAVPLPRMAPPRTTNNPEPPQIWEMTLEQAIQIGLDNSEVVRVIALGAQGIPVQGFEPSPLNVAGAAGGQLGSGSLATVYDTAIQEVQIAQALSQFDASIQATLFWSHQAQPFNNALQTGFFSATRFPVIGIQDSINFSAALQKRTATGATLSVTQNAVYQYTNNPNNVFPSFWQPNLQFRFSQPLLGSAPNNFNGQPVPAGLEANRAPIVVARLNADASVWRFKAEIMNLVRSIEQLYWALAQAQLQYWASETAVQLGEQILQQAIAKEEIGTGERQTVAEAAEQLERFRLEYINQTSQLLNTERQFRNLLGLPPSDNRRILPTTAPTEARIEPDWDSSLAQMVAYQPDIVQNQLLVRVAELQLLVARNQLLPVLSFDLLYQLNGFGKDLDEAFGVMTGKTLQAIDPILQFQQRQAGLNPQPGQYNGFQTWQAGITFQMPIGYRGPLANVRQAQFVLMRQRAYLQQVVHQQAHYLNRFFLEVDANYKLFKTASRLKAAALERIEVQRALYETGKSTIDRYLDAVNRWAQAVTLEAQYRAQYNIAIAALEETKGTLLAYNNVVLAEGPWPAKAYIQARDQRAAHGRFPIGEDGNLTPRPANRPQVADPVPVQPPPNAEPAGPLPPLPAPAGPFGPQPLPAAPGFPAGEPPIIGENRPPASGTPIGGAYEPEVVPAAGTASDEPPPIELPPLPAPVSPDLTRSAKGMEAASMVPAGAPGLSRNMTQGVASTVSGLPGTVIGERRVELLPPLPELAPGSSIATPPAAAPEAGKPQTGPKADTPRDALPPLPPQ